MWPREAFPISAVVVLASVAAFAVVLVGAPGTTKPFVAVAFVAMAAVEVPLYLAAMRRVLEGRPVPGWTRLVQVALVAAGFAVTGPASEVGSAMVAGLFAAMFAGNLWAIRSSRPHQTLVDEVKAELARQP